MDIKSILKDYSVNTGSVEVQGKTWNIKELTASNMDSMGKAKGELEMAAIAIIGGVTNEDQKLVFKLADKEALMDTLTVADIIKVSTAIIELSGLGKTEE